MVAAPTPYAESRATLLARSGLTGSGRRAALSELSDTWLAGLLPENSGVALVAVGGYGRTELSPGSDLDVVLLHGGRKAGPDIAAIAERVWYPVWDAGVRLDHSVRTIAEARRTAADDLRAVLGLLDARHIAGDAALTEELRQLVLSDWRRSARTRLPELLESCRERWHRQGELAFLLEPDLKEARGGLRDILVLRAVAASWVADYPHSARFDVARERLLDIRDALHAVTGRPVDRLQLQEQDPVAAYLGVLDADALLGRVCDVGRTVAYAADVTWRRVEQSLVARPGRRLLRPAGNRQPGERQPLALGAVEQNGEVVLARDARPDRDPVLPLRMAAAAAQAGLPLAPHAVERLAGQAAPLPVPWPPEARDALVTLLGAGHAAIPVWEALDQAGLVERLLPDWARVRSRPQRNPVHRFTVDRHLVECAAHAAALTRRVARPDLLLVGCLLHDIGKGWPGDHTEAGVVVVRDMAPRLGFSTADTDILVTLTLLHLLLPDTATRRDLDDPATISGVAAAVSTTEVLDLLHALTEADGLATGPAAWNDWKAGLVTELVRRTRGVLNGAAPTSMPPLTSEQQLLADKGELAVTMSVGSNACHITIVAPDRIGLLAIVAGVLALHRLSVRSAVARTLGGVAVDTWLAIPEFGTPPDVEVVREDLRRALDGSLDVAHRLARREANYPVRSGVRVAPARVQVVPGASESATVLEVRAHDRPALLHRIARTLAVAGVDVRTARVSTLGAEAVDVFYVTDRDGLPLLAPHANEIARVVRDALR
jgi:[protein-PII] uridylyltransferase